ncbi:hypothetical protein ACT1U9_10700 [Streptomyces sp. BR1]|uniref:hypothetical protein n=1 Tax=Streptomyces sp. BR1 TaxID=1592323 RepID=UPI00402B4925
MTGLGQQVPPAELTLRVSRDGGRTWGPTRVIPAVAPLVPLYTSEWPPCRCAPGVQRH